MIGACRWSNACMHAKSATSAVRREKWVALLARCSLLHPMMGPSNVALYTVRLTAAWPCDTMMLLQKP